MIFTIGSVLQVSILYNMSFLLLKCGLNISSLLNKLQTHQVHACISLNLWNICQLWFMKRMIDWFLFISQKHACFVPTCLCFRYTPNGRITIWLEYCSSLIPISLINPEVKLEQTKSSSCFLKNILPFFFFLQHDDEFNTKVQHRRV